METLAAILGAFLFFGYVQTHELGAPLLPVSDPERLERSIQATFEWTDVISTKTVAPVDIYANYTPVFGSGKEPK